MPYSSAKSSSKNKNIVTLAVKKKVIFGFNCLRKWNVYIFFFHEISFIELVQMIENESLDKNMITKYLK